MQVHLKYKVTEKLGKQILEVSMSNRLMAYLITVLSMASSLALLQAVNLDTYAGKYIHTFMHLWPLFAVADIAFPLFSDSYEATQDVLLLIWVTLFDCIIRHILQQNILSVPRKDKQLCLNFRSG